MSNASALAIILAVGAITYAARAGLILLLADRPLPESVQRALRYVGPAVLSALVVTLLAGGEGSAGIDRGEIAAVVIAAIVAFLTRNLIAALVAGMLAIWLLPL